MQGRHGDSEIAQDLLAERRESGDDRDRHGYGLPREPFAGAAAAPTGQRQEHGDGAGRIHDHDERDEDLGEQLAVEGEMTHDRARLAAVI